MKYNKDFPKKLIEHMSNGLSFESFGAVINTTVEDMDAWLVQYKEFDEAERIGTLHRKLIWEKMGLVGAQGKSGFDRQAWEVLKPPPGSRYRRKL